MEDACLCCQCQHPAKSAILGRVTTTYHHGNLREALVEAALVAVREQGPDGLALRELARRVGVSHNAAYRHFADRLRLASVQHRDPMMLARLRLFELGRSYVAFALSEPGLFRIAFSAYPQIESSPGLIDPSTDEDPLAQLNTTLDGLVDAGYLAAGLRPAAEITCWSAVHGFSVLHLEGPLRELPAELRDASLVQMLTSIDRGYGATTGNMTPLELRSPQSSNG
jgi:AcrR family transcriptional regulator